MKNTQTQNSKSTGEKLDFKLARLFLKPESARQQIDHSTKEVA